MKFTFERYTEKARRVIFFSRYEAARLGRSHIETEHLLLGVLREDQNLVDCVPIDPLREQLEEKTTPLKAVPAVDLPLSDESKRVLRQAAQEADALGDRHIGTEHLLLALLLEQNCYAAKLLNERGLDVAGARNTIERLRRERQGQ